MSPKDSASHVDSERCQVQPIEGRCSISNQAAIHKTETLSRARIPPARQAQLFVFAAPGRSALRERGCGTGGCFLPGFGEDRTAPVFAGSAIATPGAAKPSQAARREPRQRELEKGMAS